MFGGVYNSAAQDVKLMIDGATVATGSIPYFSHGTAELAGSHLGRDVTATCNQTFGFWGEEQISCITFIDARRGPTVTF